MLLRVVLACVILFTLAISSAFAQEEPLPGDIREELEAMFEGWRLPTDADLAVGSDPYCQSPLHFIGDFDGDGREDHVVQVIYRPDPDGEMWADPNGEAWVVAVLLRRDDSFEIHTRHFGGGLATLGKDEAGSEVHVPLLGDLFMLNDRTTFTLQADALTVGYCEKASTLYFYYGGAFLAAITGD